MQPTSQAFLDAITGDHDMAVRMEVYSPTTGSVVLTIEHGAVPSPTDVRIIDGSVTLSKSADIRSTANVKLVDPTFTLAGPDTVLSPYGNQLFLYRGVVFPNGSIEYVRLCTCRISSVKVAESGGGLTIDITAYGLERTVARNVVDYFWPPTSTVDYGGLLALSNASHKPVPPNQCPFYTDFISVLISDRYPAAQFDSSAYSGPAPFATPSAWAQRQYLVGTDSNGRLNYTASLNLSQGANPWAAARQAADAVGCDLFCDRYGIFTLITDPNLVIMDSNYIAAPVATFVEGQTATFLTVDRTLSDEDGVNAVVVTGDGSSLVGPVQTPFYQDLDNSITFPAASGGGANQYGTGNNYNQMTLANPGELFVDATSFQNSFWDLPGWISSPPGDENPAGSLYVRTVNPGGPIVISYTTSGSNSFKGCVTQPQDAPPSITISAADDIRSLFHANSTFANTGDQRVGFPVTYDNDPDSPTYFFGPFGKVSKVVSSSIIFSSQMAQSYSALLLKRSLGIQEQVTFTNICNPALDPDDVISIRRVRVGLDGIKLYVIDEVSIPLTAKGDQQVKLRERRSLTI